MSVLICLQIKAVTKTGSSQIAARSFQLAVLSALPVLVLVARALAARGAPRSQEYTVHGALSSVFSSKLQGAPKKKK
jgi:hypothetical protein